MNEAWNRSRNSRMHAFFFPVYMVTNTSDLSQCHIHEQKIISWLREDLMQRGRPSRMVTLHWSNRVTKNGRSFLLLLLGAFFIFLLLNLNENKLLCFSILRFILANSYRLFLSHWKSCAPTSFISLDHLLVTMQPVGRLKSPHVR